MNSSDVHLNNRNSWNKHSSDLLDKSLITLYTYSDKKTFKLNLKLSVAFKKIAMNLLIINLLTNSFRNFVMNSSSLNRCF